MYCDWNHDNTRSDIQFISHVCYNMTHITVVLFEKKLFFIKLKGETNLESFKRTIKRGHLRCSSN